MTTDHPHGTHGYASVNGLEMYYENHGAGAPLVLLHGAMGTIETDFGKLLPSLATTRQVVAIEQQAHGHTADIDRPLSYDQMVEDTAALVRQLGLDNADFFGYSMGGGIALQLAMRHPDLVRKFVWAGAASYSLDGLYPELMAGIEQLQPEHLAGTPWQQAYARTPPASAIQPQDRADVAGLVRQVEARSSPDRYAISSASSASAAWSSPLSARAARSAAAHVTHVRAWVATSAASSDGNASASHRSRVSSSGQAIGCHSLSLEFAAQSLASAQ